jgi:hypothetical protein
MGPFSLAMHHSAPAAMGATTTFDPLNKTSFATLSNGNLTITWDGGAPGEEFATAAGTVNATVGKRIFGCVISELAFAFLSLDPEGYDIAAAGGGPSGAGGPGLTWINEFGVVVDGGEPSPVTPFLAGDIAEIIYDVSTSTAWLALNGTVLSGDPVAGTGGYTMSANNPQPSAGIASAGSITANFGQTAFAYSGAGILPWG